MLLHHLIHVLLALPAVIGQDSSAEEEFNTVCLSKD
jgi:hypothetical protein